MRAGAEANEWAKKRQMAIERARQLKEERKNGLLKTGEMALGGGGGGGGYLGDSREEFIPSGG